MKLPPSVHRCLKRSEDVHGKVCMDAPTKKLIALSNDLNHYEKRETLFSKIIKTKLRVSK